MYLKKCPLYFYRNLIFQNSNFFQPTKWLTWFPTSHSPKQSLVVVQVALTTFERHFVKLPAAKSRVILWRPAKRLKMIKVDFFS